MGEHRQGELFPSDETPWELDAQSITPVAHVVFPEAPFGPYSYRIPEEFAGKLMPSMRVVVPLGKGIARSLVMSLGWRLRSIVRIP